MNFITGVPPSLRVDGKTYDAILVVVDCYTKLVKYYLILKTIMAEQFGNLLIHTAFCSFGVPSSIFSNQGSIFMSILWLALCLRLSASGVYSGRVITGVAVARCGLQQYGQLVM